MVVGRTTVSVASKAPGRHMVGGPLEVAAAVDRLDNSSSIAMFHPWDLGASDRYDKLSNVE